MGKKSKKITGGGIVYSTDKSTMDQLFENIRLPGSQPSSDASPNKKFDDEVRIWLDRKRKGGKEATMIKGIQTTDTRLKEIAKKLKSACGVGGTAKNGEILIQGNHRDKVLSILLEMGYYKTKKAGG